jgi:hypothetical protein
MPREVIVVPAVVHGEVMAIFYGDNLPSEVSIGPVTELELALVEACASQATATGPESGTGGSVQSASS